MAEEKEKQRRNTPPHPLHAGYVARHEAMSITPATKSRRKNSILQPGISMAEEVEAINRGLGIRLPGNRYAYNGRIWIDKGTGETFPESGAGVWKLSGAQFDLLKSMLKEGWRGPNSDRMVLQDPFLNQDLAETVELLFNLIRTAHGGTIPDQG